MLSLLRPWWPGGLARWSWTRPSESRRGKMVYLIYHQKLRKKGQYHVFIAQFCTSTLLRFPTNDNTQTQITSKSKKRRARLPTLDSVRGQGARYQFQVTVMCASLEFTTTDFAIPFTIVRTIDFTMSTKHGRFVWWGLCFGLLGFVGFVGFVVFVIGDCF